jgi:hypothetical protein
MNININISNQTIEGNDITPYDIPYIVTTFSDVDESDTDLMFIITDELKSIFKLKYEKSIIEFCYP